MPAGRKSLTGVAEAARDRAGRYGRLGHLQDAGALATIPNGSLEPTRILADIYPGLDTSPVLVPSPQQEPVLARIQQTPTAATDETRVRADAEPGLLQPRDDAETGRPKDLPLFGRGHGGAPDRGPELRGNRASLSRPRCPQCSLRRIRSYGPACRADAPAMAPPP